MISPTARFTSAREIEKVDAILEIKEYVGRSTMVSDDTVLDDDDEFDVDEVQVIFEIIEGGWPDLGNILSVNDS